MLKEKLGISSSSGLVFKLNKRISKLKNRLDKGKFLVRKLGQKVKTEDKKEVKLEETPKPLKDDNEPKVYSPDIKGKYSLFSEEKDQPMQHMAAAKISCEDKVAVTKEITVQEEDIQT